MMTSEPWTERPLQLTLFAEDSHASRFPRPGSDEARRMTVISGRRCVALLPKSDPLGSLAKMFLESSQWHSTRCYLTWKAWGTPGGRLFYQLRPWTPGTFETECGSWRAMQQAATNGKPMGRELQEVAPGSMVPTPIARDWKSGRTSAKTREKNSRPLSEFVGGSLSPQWVEWLMGFPEGWTDLSP